MMTVQEKEAIRDLLKLQSESAEKYMADQTAENFKEFTRAQWNVTDAMMSARLNAGNNECCKSSPECSCSALNGGAK